MECPDKYIEIFDVNALDHIIKYKSFYKTIIIEDNGEDCKYDPFNLLIKYKKKASGNNMNLVRVSYHKANGRGRKYANDSLSLQSFPRAIRGSLAKNDYYDIDLVNCHPVIINQICKNKNILVSSLEMYILKRDELINDILKMNENLNKDFVKRAILSILYGGFTRYKSIKNKTEWIKLFYNEMKNLLLKVQTLFPKEYEQQQKIKGQNYYNLNGSTLSALVNVEEDKCLDIMINHLKNKNYIINNIAVLCFDGIMVYNKTKNNSIIKVNKLETTLKEIEKLLSENTGYNLKLKIKPFECLPTDIPDEYHDIAIQEELNKKPTEILDDYINDKFYWYDFIKLMTGKIYENVENLEDEFKKNINRVSLRIFKLDKFFIRKINKSNMFEFDTSLPKDSLRYYRTTINDIKIMNVSIAKLLTEYGFINHLNTYDELDFKPYSKLFSKKDTLERNFNSWGGFECELLPENEVDVSKIEIILNHIRKCWCADNDKIYTYVLSWFKQIFTKPYLKTKVALVLKSFEKQIGKGILITEFLIPFVFGKSYSMSEAGLESVTQKFNKIMMNKLFINCDELSSLENEFHQKFDILKKRITDNTISIEIKGGEKFIYPDYSNYLFCTNNDFTIKVEIGDARYCILECSPCFKGNYKYFDELIECFNKETANHFYSYVSYFNGVEDVRDIPFSSLKKDMMTMSLPSPLRFLLDVKNKNYILHEDGDEWIRSTHLYQYFDKWRCSNNEKIVSHTKFSKIIRPFIEKRKKNDSNMYNINSIDILLK